MTPEEFITWALDPARTVEEKFTVEVLTEHGLSQWKARNVPLKQRDFCKEMDRAEKRRELRQHNPAYVPQLRREDVERAAPMLAISNYWSHMGSWDRKLGDLTALKVMQRAENLHVNDVDGADLAPLAALPALKALHLQTSNLCGAAALGRCLALEELHFRCPQSWPETPPLHLLPALKRLAWYANIFLLEEMPALPALERLATGTSAGFRDLPLRHMGRLPRMPALRMLQFRPCGDLAGIERFPELLGLDLEGFIPSLEPLSALQKLTHLKLTLLSPVSLKPLAALPELRWLMIRSDLPFDYSPLAELPRLRELLTPPWLPRRDGTDAADAPVPLDVSTIRSLLEPWEADFAGLRPEPLPLPPLRCIVRPENKPEQDCSAFPPTPPPFLDNIHLRASFAAWAGRKVVTALDALLGKSWRGLDDDDEETGGRVSGFSDIPGMSLHDTGGFRQGQSFTIQTAEAAERLPEIIECIRRVWATLPGNWTAFIVVDLNPEWVRCADYWKSGARRRFEEFEEEERDMEERRRKLRDYQERALRLQMAREAGHTIVPEDYAPDAKTHDIWQSDQELRDQQDEANDDAISAAEDDDEDGGVAVKEADPQRDEPDKHPLGEAYQLYANLYMDLFIVAPHTKLAAAILMGEIPEEIPEEPPGDPPAAA